MGVFEEVMLQNRTHQHKRRISTEIALLWGISGVLLCGLSGGDAYAQRRDRKKVESAQTENVVVKPLAVCAISVRNILEQPLMARIRLLPAGGGEALSFELENGTGEGEIQPFAPGMLVVTQTRRTHSRVAALLDLLRETKQAIAADSAGRPADASRRPVTRAITLEDEVIASCAEARRTIQTVLQNSVDWSLEVEGAKADELFLKVLPNRILVRHAPQVVLQVERMAKVVSPPDQSKFAGSLCGGGGKAEGSGQAGATPDLAEPAKASEDGEQRQQAGGEGFF